MADICCHSCKVCGSRTQGLPLPTAQKVFSSIELLFIQVQGLLQWSEQSNKVRAVLVWPEVDAKHHFMLSSHGWEKVLEEDNDLAAIDWLVERFGTPLQSAEANIDAIRDEFAGMIEYAVQYIAIATLDYHSGW